MGPTRSPHDSMHNICLSATPISAMMYPQHQGQSLDYRRCSISIILAELINKVKEGACQNPCGVYLCTYMNLYMYMYLKPVPRRFCLPENHKSILFLWSIPFVASLTPT